MAAPAMQRSKPISHSLEDPALYREVEERINHLCSSAVNYYHFPAKYMDDLISDSWLVAFKCTVEYKSSDYPGVPFMAFCYQRIRTAVIDRHRNVFGRRPHYIETFKEMGRLERKRQRYFDPSFKNFEASADLQTIIGRCSWREWDGSSGDQRKGRVIHILHRYYFDGVPMHQIGREMGITECRISQIISAALNKLRITANARL
jgi:DNA-directed RNA polymerase specialized sigma24 family protein